MAFSEVFTALQTGVIDGQENPFAQIWSAKFQEVQEYLSLTGHVYTPAYVTAGKQRFESLPPEVQQVLVDTAKETQGFVYETAAAMEGDLLAQLEEGGMQVNEADKDAFIEASQPIYDEFSSEVDIGKKLIDAAISLGQAS
jgi:TRAP-type C4-dicarboxylate transport system substrate-binding protein